MVIGAVIIMTANRVANISLILLDGRAIKPADNIPIPIATAPDLYDSHSANKNPKSGIMQAINFLDIEKNHRLMGHINTLTTAATELSQKSPDPDSKFIELRGMPFVN